MMMNRFDRYVGASSASEGLNSGMSFGTSFSGTASGTATGPSTEPVIGSGLKNSMSTSLTMRVGVSEFGFSSLAYWNEYRTWVLSRTYRYTSSPTAPGI